MIFRGLNFNIRWVCAGSGTKEGVQSEIISITFKKFVTKMMKQVSWKQERWLHLTFINCKCRCPCWASLSTCPCTRRWGSSWHSYTPLTGTLSGEWCCGRMRSLNWSIFRKVVVSGLLLSIPTVENYRVEGKSYSRLDSYHHVRGWICFLSSQNVWETFICIQ